MVAAGGEGERLEGESSQRDDGDGEAMAATGTGAATATGSVTASIDRGRRCFNGETEEETEGE